MSLEKVMTTEEKFSKMLEDSRIDLKIVILKFAQEYTRLAKEECNEESDIGLKTVSINGQDFHFACECLLSAMESFDKTILPRVMEDVNLEILIPYILNQGIE